MMSFAGLNIGGLTLGGSRNGGSAGNDGEENPSRKDYGSARAYAEEVRQWMECTRFWLAGQQMLNQAANFNSWMMHQNQQAFAMAMAPQQGQSQANAQFQPQPQWFPMPAAQQQQVPQVPAGNRMPVLRLNLTRFFRNGGAPQSAHPMTIIVQQCIIPSFWRRMVAESIDSSLLFIFKLMLVLMLVETDLIDTEQFEKVLIGEVDLYAMFEMTRGLFYVEILFKLLTAIFEGLCITYGVANLPLGCTPGKYMLRLRVISCIDVQRIPSPADQQQPQAQAQQIGQLFGANGLNGGRNAPMRVAVAGYQTIPLKNSLIRALLKNTLTVFLFPASIVFYAFSYNRAIYDIAAKTLVVSM